MKRFSLFIYSILFIVSTGTVEAQILAGNRKIGMQMDVSKNNDWNKSYTFIDTLCVDYIHIPAVWNEIEKNKNSFDFNALNFRIEQVKQHGNLKVEINIAPVHMSVKTFPTDLMSCKINDPAVVSRFKSFIDSVFFRLDTVQLTCLNIGNEHDNWLLYDTTDFISRIGHWIYFYKQVAPYAKAQYAAKHGGAQLKVGTTFTYSGLTNSYARIFTKYVNDSCLTDIISLTYYGADTGFFNFKSPDKIPADFDSLVTVYKNQTKPFMFAECGYPSGDSCGSSELKQSQFYESVFKGWDKNKDRIQYITIFSLVDWPWSLADYLANLISNGAYTQEQFIRFREYLHTLGISYYETGLTKPSYETIRCEIAKRSFCNTDCLLKLLTVNSGNGGGTYKVGSKVTIRANTPPAGKVFDKWTGDITEVADIYSDSTAIIMGWLNETVTATYKDIVNSFRIADTKYNVYPNPVTDYLCLRDIENINSVTLCSVSGQIMFSKIIKENNLILDLRNFESGIYMLYLTSENGEIKIEKICIQK